MEGLYWGYIFGLLMSVLMFIPILYGLWVNGIEEKVEKVFSCFIVVNLIWSGIQLVQVIVDTVSHLIVIEIILLTVMWASIYTAFMFAVVYTRRERWFDKRVIGLSLMPVVAYILITIHTYFTVEPTVVTEPFTHLTYPMNMFDAFGLFYTFSLFAMAYIFFIDFYRKNDSKASKGIPILMFGLSVPIVLGFISYFDEFILVNQFNHGPLGFPVFAVSVIVAMYQFDILNVKPIALDRFIQDLPNPLFILDTEKQILDCNESAEEFVRMGVGRGEEFDSVVPFDSTTIEGIFSGDEITGEIVSEKIGGLNRYFMVSSSVVYDDDGKFIGWVVYVKDITSVERQREELERQNNQLERFADGITHEIRNPLAIATQYSELYFESLIDEGEAMVTPEKAYDVIQNAHHRMDEIIDNIRWLSKFGQTIEETEQVQVSSIVRDSWLSVKGDGGAEVDVVQDGLIEAESGRLKSVFDNLFKNSLRYAGDDCRITVEVTESNEILIRDNGPGIPDDEQEYLFDYGYTTSDKGTGFGLSLVKTVVEAHGWDIEVDTSYTEGAGFRISGVDVIEIETS